MLIVRMRVVRPLPNDRSSMAYKWGGSLLTLSNWDEPSSAGGGGEQK